MLNSFKFDVWKTFLSEQELDLIFVSIFSSGYFLQKALIFPKDSHWESKIGQGKHVNWKVFKLPVLFVWEHPETIHQGVSKDEEIYKERMFHVKFIFW